MSFPAGNVEIFNSKLKTGDKVTNKKAPVTVPVQQTVKKESPSLSQKGLPTSEDFKEHITTPSPVAKAPVAVPVQETVKKESPSLSQKGLPTSEDFKERITTPSPVAKTPVAVPVQQTVKKESPSLPRKGLPTSEDFKHVPVKISKTNELIKRIGELSDTLKDVSEEIRAIDISKETVGIETPQVSEYKEISTPKNSHFYVGGGLEFEVLMFDDKIKSDRRVFSWSEQKIDYYSMVSSVFSIIQRDSYGNIIYGDDGYPKYSYRINPKDIPEIKACYETREDPATVIGGVAGTGQKKMMLIAGKQYEVQNLLKTRVDELIGITSKDPIKSLNLVTGSGKEISITHTHVNIGQNEYGHEHKEQFYFSANEGNGLTYKDGIQYLDALIWGNLVFTDDAETAVGAKVEAGAHVPLTQVLGDIIEQTDETVQYTTNSGQIATFTNLYSERVKSNGSDVFKKSAELAAINENVRQNKFSFGGNILLGWGAYTGKVYYGAEVSAGYSAAVSKISKQDESEPVVKDLFADGNMQYVSSTSTAQNKASGEVRKVYVPLAGTVQPVYVSGMGRLTAVTPSSLPDIKTAYEVEIKKGFNFSITPILGLSHASTVYYLSLGMTCDAYEVKISPNTNMLDAYSNMLPITYINGYLEGFGGNTYLHKYKTRITDGGQLITQEELLAEKKKVEKMEPIYPAAVLETNTAGEQNTFSGIRITYPHYADGGISVEGEGDARPWLNQENVSKEIKMKKYMFRFEPGIGFRTYLTSKYFIDLRTSVGLGEKIKIDHDSFAAYPAHIGRPKLRHEIDIIECKVKLSFGRKL
jgi:hypothetical protein